MAFRIGRKHAYHTYPESRRSTTLRLARNFASGPKESVTLEDTATLIPWAAIDSVSAWNAIVSHLGTTWISLQAANLNNTPVEGAFWTQNTVVPITPRSTGVVVIHANIAFESGAVGLEEVVINVLVNGVALLVPASIEVSFDVDQEGLIPILAEVTGLPIGVRADIAIELEPSAADVFSLAAGNTTIEVREMQAATG